MDKEPNARELARERLIAFAKGVAVAAIFAAIIATLARPT